MEIYETIAGLRAVIAKVKNRGMTVALVPTMGNLHEGHFSLVRKARAECDFVLTSLFINPTQFGPNEDLSRYPRSFEQDKAALEALGCDALFAPPVSEMYPQGPVLSTVVSVPELAGLHCGSSRPGHFDGVCTVVSKLFNICRPDKACFGEKDYQQLAIIRRMTADLDIPVEIISVPTVREAGGLALSSRNNYLSARQKESAAVLYRSLQACAEAIRSAASPADFAGLEKESRQKIADAGLRPDYFSICQADTLLSAGPGDKSLVILTAAWLENTRLIDNIFLTLP